MRPTKPPKSWWKELLEKVWTFVLWLGTEMVKHWVKLLSLLFGGWLVTQAVSRQAQIRAMYHSLPGHVAAWFAAALVVVVVLVFALAALAAWKKSTKAWHLYELRMGLPSSTRKGRGKRRQPARAETIEHEPFPRRCQRFLNETRRLWISGGSIACVLAMTGLFLFQSRFTLAATIFARNGSNQENIRLVVHSPGKTFTTGVTMQDGSCQFNQQLWPGSYRLIAYRQKNGWTEWSEFDFHADKAHATPDFHDFPQYVCPVEPIRPVLFAPDKARLSQEDESHIDEAIRELHRNPAQLLLEGHTSPMPQSDPSGQRNYELSCERCESIKSKMTGSSFGTDSFIIAPFDCRCPLPESAERNPSDIHRNQRAVRIIPLRKLKWEPYPTPVPNISLNPFLDVVRGGEVPQDPLLAR